jgi:hypothetical protein
MATSTAGGAPGQVHVNDADKHNHQATEPEKSEGLHQKVQPDIFRRGKGRERKQFRRPIRKVHEQEEDRA